MLGEGETQHATGSLLVVLWLEVIIYLGIGLYEWFGLDFKPPKPFMRNAFEMFTANMNQKFHASICMVLGVVALQGIVSGVVSRFEFEMMFFTLGLINSLCWLVFAWPIGAKGWLLAIGIKPEFWFQLWIWCTKADLVRMPVLVVCGLLNIHGFLLAWFVLRPKMGDVNNLAKMIGESDPEMKEKLEQIGMLPKTSSAREPLLISVEDV